MVNVGSIKGEFIIDDSQFSDATKRSQVNSQKTEKSMKGMTKSVLTAQVAFAAISKAINSVINIGKKSITAFIQQEKSVAQLNATLKSTNNAIGMTSEELQNLASSLQDATTFGDEAIISAENLLLTFTKIGKDVFPEATEMVLDMSIALRQGLKESSIQLGKALQDPILGITALRRVGVNFSDSQKEMVKQLVESGRQLEAQKLILTELQTEFGGSARAARDTFGGSLEALSNIQGDVLEKFGQLASIVGKDIVDSMTKGAVSVRDWLSNATNFAAMTDAMEGIMTGIIAPLKSLKQLFKDLFKSFNVGNKEIDPVIIGLKTVSSIILLLGKSLAIQIEFWAAFIDVVKNAGKALYEVWQAVKGEQSWKQAWSNIKDLGSESFSSIIKRAKDFGKNLIKETKDIWKQDEKEIKAANDRINLIVSNSQKKLSKIMTEEEKRRLEESIELEKENQKNKKAILEEWQEISSKMAEDSYGEQIEIIKQKQAQYLSAAQGNKEEEIKINQWAAGEILKIEKEKNKSIYDGIADISSRLARAVTDTGNIIADTIGEITNSIFKGVSKVMEGLKLAIDNLAAGILETVAGIAEVISQVYQSISDMQVELMEEDLERMKAKHAEEIENLEESKSEQLEAIQDNYDSELETLQEKLDNDTITQEQYDEQKAILDEKKAAKEEATIKKMEDKIANEKKKNRKKEDEQKKKIFEANKANQIAQIWIQTAIGVVSAFAGACQWPGVSMIAGLIFAGIMSGILIASAIAQTIVVGQQKYTPGLAIGGVLDAGESAIINERGTEIITPGVSSYITPASITSQILENVGKSQQKSDNYMSVSFAGANISDNMSLRKVTRYVSSELGKQVKDL